MAGSHINNGIVLVPDSCNLTEDMKEETFLAANYNATTEEEKEEIEKICTGETETEFSKNLNEKDITIDGMTKIAIIESSLGVSTTPQTIRFRHLSAFASFKSLLSLISK